MQYSIQYSVGIVIDYRLESLESDLVDTVSQHHQVHQSVGRLHVPLAVRLLRVAPHIPRVDSVAGLEGGGQHRETVEPVGQAVHGGHEGGPQDVDLQREYY